jgi:hypothetical protein
MVLEIIWNCGGDKFAEDFGFKAQTSKAYLESGGNIHKTIQFVMDVVWPALNNAAIRQYHSENPDCDLDRGDLFVEWLKNTSHGDATFQSHAFLLTHVLPALYCVITGQRINNMTMYLAGCKTLCRFIFVLGKYNYGPAMLNEWLVLWRSTKEVLRQRFENFSPLGEPFGLKLEASNRRVKRARTSTTKAGWSWAIIMEEVAKSFRTNILHQLGLREREYEERTANDNTPDVIDIATKLYDAETWVAVPGRTEVKTFVDNKTLRHGLHELYIMGQERMDAYVPLFLNEDSPSFPPKVFMSDALEVKTRLARVKALVTRAANLAAKKAAQATLGQTVSEEDNTTLLEAEREVNEERVQLEAAGGQLDVVETLRDIVDEEALNAIDANDEAEDLLFD